jgi:hypothetical protein
MERVLNRTIFDEWISKHGPNGVGKLAIEAQVSLSTIQNIRRTSTAPKKYCTCEKISKALGKKIDDVFPTI